MKGTAVPPAETSDPMSAPLRAWRWFNSILHFAGLLTNLVFNIIAFTTVVPVESEITAYHTLWDTLPYFLFPIWFSGIVLQFLDVFTVWNLLWSSRKAHTPKALYMISKSASGNWGILLMLATVLDALSTYSLGNPGWSLWITFFFSLFAFFFEGIVDDRRWLVPTFMYLKCGSGKYSTKHIYELWATERKSTSVLNFSFWISQAVPYQMWNAYLFWNFMRVITIFRAVVMNPVDKVSDSNLFIILSVIFFVYHGILKGLVNESVIWLLATSLIYLGIMIVQKGEGLTGPWIVSLCIWVIYMLASIPLGWNWVIREEDVTESKKVHAKGGVIDLT
jgi:hypothetical protein